ncbi:Fic family protein [Celerinatantimonas sp. MCCC 1A17872]|uniref:Fic family protein n=1 Tax=Celerinatantimonas sp. MCCC 1A17872 TaxID=3177514 RepID=UPI0038C3E93E
MNFQSQNISDIEYIDSKIIHIKKTPNKSGYCNIFWNKTRGEIIIGKSKVQLPVPSIAHQHKYYKCYSDMSRNEIQVGDSVCYIFAKEIQPLICATIVGTTKHQNKPFLLLQANHPEAPVQKTWARYDKNRFILIADNHCNDIDYRHLAASNLVYARYADELESIEQYYAMIRSTRYILKLLQQSNTVFGRNALSQCHHTLFDGIYSWAGQYRKEEVVVTNRNFPTMHPSDLSKAMEEFSDAFASRYLNQIRKDKTRLLQALVFAHQRLAWIHPFSDGNGRAIRLYLEAIAKTRGFTFSLSKAISTNKRKHYYHYAVRRAIKNDTKYLRGLLSAAISDN